MYTISIIRWEIIKEPSLAQARYSAPFVDSKPGPKIRLRIPRASLYTVGNSQPEEQDQETPRKWAVRANDKDRESGLKEFSDVGNMEPLPYP